MVSKLKQTQILVSQQDKRHRSPAQVPTSAYAYFMMSKLKQTQIYATKTDFTDRQGDLGKTKVVKNDWSFNFL